MLISDWSSYVCSSDLPALRSRTDRAAASRYGRSQCRFAGAREDPPHLGTSLGVSLRRFARNASRRRRTPTPQAWAEFPTEAWSSQREQAQANAHAASASRRSEEHTSELQSLMRISYAVFCLKKNKITKHISHTMPHTTPHCT